MRLLRICLLVALGPWLGGCPAIVSEQPLGEEIAIFDADKVNGVWLVPGGVLVGARVLDGKKGLLSIWTVGDSNTQDTLFQCHPPPVGKIACNFGGDGETPRADVCVWRRQSIPEAWPCEGCSLFVPEMQVEVRAGKYYLTVFTLLSDAKSYAIFYAVPEDIGARLEALISKGLLPDGHNQRSEFGVVLGPLSPEQHRLIFSEESGLFRWTPPPLVLVKLPDKLDPCKAPVQSK